MIVSDSILEYYRNIIKNTKWGWDSNLKKFFYFEYVFGMYYRKFDIH